MEFYTNFHKQIWICAKEGIKEAKKIRLRNKRIGNNTELIYKTVVAPHSDYCTTMLYLSNEVNLNKIEVIPNRGMRCKNTGKRQVCKG